MDHQLTDVKMVQRNKFTRGHSDLTTQTTLRKQISDISLLNKCWKSIYSGKKEDIREFSRGIDEVSINGFKENLATNLAGISYSLSNGEYEMLPLKAIPIPKGKNKDRYRLVTSPSVSDRIVHKAILSAINGIFYPLINTGVSYCGVRENVFSYRKKKSKNHISAIKQLAALVREGNFWVFESDIEGFFDNVPKESLYNSIVSALPDSSINDLIRQVIFFKIGNLQDLKKKKYIGKLRLPHQDTGISQGSPLSPLFSNIYLHNLDIVMKQACGTSYIRYVDDFIIVSDNEKKVEELGKKSRQEFENIGLKLADGKTETVHLKDGGKSIKFLGLKINNQKITAKDPGAVKSKFDTEYLRSSKESIRSMNYKIQGCANYYAPFHSRKLFEDLNSLIESKKKSNTKFKGLRLIQNISTGHKYGLPSEKEWKNYFKVKPLSTLPSTN